MRTEELEAPIAALATSTRGPGGRWITPRTTWGAVVQDRLEERLSGGETLTPEETRQLRALQEILEGLW